jgi:hypothetical protein
MVDSRIVADMLSTMIFHWWWLVSAFFLGIALGLLAVALIDWRYKRRRDKAAQVHASDQDHSLHIYIQSACPDCRNALMKDIKEMILKKMPDSHITDH